MSNKGRETSLQLVIIIAKFLSSIVLFTRFNGIILSVLFIKKVKFEATTSLERIWSSCGTHWKMSVWQRELQFAAASSIKISRSQGLFWRGVSAVISVTSSRALPQ